MSDQQPQGAAATTSTATPTVNVINGDTKNHVATASSPTDANSQQQSQAQQQQQQQQQQVVLDKKRLQELVKEVDPYEQLDEEVEELLLHIADDFIEQTVTAAAQLAKHRKANSIDTKDVQLVLERNWNMWVPGFGTSGDEAKSHKKSAMSDAHRARMAIIRKNLKKY